MLQYSTVRNPSVLSIFSGNLITYPSLCHCESQDLQAYECRLQYSHFLAHERLLQWVRIMFRFLFDQLEFVHSF